MLYTGKGFFLPIIIEFMPKLSVILPSYNHAKFLRPRIDSILKQSYQDFELIILDDASTDNSLEIIRGYADDQRVQIVANIENSGSTFRQWNKGIKLAKGEYIWLAESDDYSEPTFLESLTTYLDHNLNVGLVYCQSKIIDEDDQVLKTNLSWTDDLDSARWREDYINTGIDEIANYFLFKNIVPNASAAIFRKSVYNSVGGAPLDMTYCGDWLLWAKLLTQCDIAFVSSPLNYFRVAHQQSVRARSINSRTSVSESLKVITFICSNSPVKTESLRETVDRRFLTWRDLLKTNKLNREEYLKLVDSFSSLIPGYEYKMYLSLLRLQLRRFLIRLVRLRMHQ